MTFGQRLSKAREEAGFTQERLAEKLYVTRQGVSRWENDKTQPSIETLGLICNILNKPPEYFIEVKEEIGRRKYRELSRSEKIAAVDGWMRSRCRFAKFKFFLLTVTCDLGIGFVAFFIVQLINSGYKLPSVWGIVGGALLSAGCIITAFLLSHRYSVLYNEYLLSEKNVVRTDKLLIV